MEIILFFIFSIIEASFNFVLTFILFSFDPKRYIKEILLSAAALSTVSYLMRNLDLGMFDVMLQVVLFALVINFVFKVHISFAICMSFGNIVYLLLQVIVIEVLKNTGLIETWVSHYSFGANIIQSLTFVLALVVMWVLKHYDFRFSFVPTSPYVKVSFNQLNVLILSLIVVQVFMTGFMYYWYTTNFGNTFFFIVLAFFAIAAFVMYLLNKKEYAYDY